MKIINGCLGGKSGNFFSSAKANRFSFEVVQIRVFSGINRRGIIKMGGYWNR